MIDADCTQTSPASLRTAVTYALDRDADLLSVLPNLDMRGFWENVIQPVCSGIMMIWFNPAKVNNPDRPHAYANGAFMLMRRSAYEQIGTHEAVKDKVNEDMHMAARIKAAGRRLRVARNQGLYRVRMYASLKAMVRGWSRIFFGTFGTLRRLTLSLTAIVLMGILPYVVAMIGAAAVAAGLGQPALWCLLAGLTAVAMQQSVIWRFYRLIGARAELAWTYLIGNLFAAAAVVIAMTKLRKGAQVVWRNTTYTDMDQVG